MATASAFAARLWKQVRDPSAATLASQILSAFLRLASNLVLARLLMPSAFGAVAITTMIATALATISDVGTWVSIVRKGDALTKDWLDQLWTLHVLRGFVIWLIAAALAPLIAGAYQDASLLWLVPVANLWLVIQGFEGLQQFVRASDLRPGFSLKLQVIGQLVGAFVSIVGALIYPSAWALVAGLLATGLTSTILSHTWAGEQLPKPRLTREFLREQWRFASWLSVSNTLGFFGGQIDRLLFPAWFGTGAFGVYSLALTLSFVPLQFGQRWADTIYMPAVAKLSRDGGCGSAQLRSLCRIVGLYAGLASAMLAGIGKPFFLALYPAKFAQAGTFVEVLAVTTYATFQTYLHRRTFLYQGMTRLEASIEASRLGLFVALLGLTVLVVGRPTQVHYVELFAAVQVMVYAGLMAVGRLKGLVHFRDDLPGLAVFVATAASMSLLGEAVTRAISPIAALFVCGIVGAIVCLVAVVRLGWPALPSAHAPQLVVDEEEPSLARWDVASSER